MISKASGRPATIAIIISVLVLAGQALTQLSADVMIPPAAKMWISIAAVAISSIVSVLMAMVPSPGSVVLSQEVLSRLARGDLAKLMESYTAPESEKPRELVSVSAPALPMSGYFGSEGKPTTGPRASPGPAGSVVGNGPGLPFLGP